MYWEPRGASEFKRRQCCEFWLSMPATYSQDTLQPWKHLSDLCLVLTWNVPSANSRVTERKKIPFSGGCPNGTEGGLKGFAGTGLVAGSWHPLVLWRRACRRRRAAGRLPRFSLHLRKELFLLEEGEGIGQEKATGTPLLCVLAERLSRIWLFVTPGTVSPPGSSVSGIIRQNTGVGVHLLLQGIYRG